MYTMKNYRTKKEIKVDLAAGVRIGVYQPGPFGGGVVNGTVYLEGPHYPEAHKWYAQGVAKDGILISMK